MGILGLSLFRREPKQDYTELASAISNGVTQQLAGKHTTEEEKQRQLAENALLASDPQLDALLTGMSQYSFKDLENKLGGGADAIYTGAIPKYVAAKIAMSHLSRTSWISEGEARIAVWELHRHFSKIKTMMSERELEEGGALVMDAAYQLAKFNVISSINGRMSKLIKSQPHSVEVAVGNVPGQKGR